MVKLTDFGFSNKFDPGQVNIKLFLNIHLPPFHLDSFYKTSTSFDDSPRSFNLTNAQPLVADTDFVGRHF